MGSCTSASIAKSAVCPVTETAGSTIKRRDVVGFSLKEAVYAPSTALKRHCHSDAYLSFVLSGSYTEKYLSRETACGEGTLRFLPAGELHENVFATATTCLLVQIEAPVLERLGEDQLRVLSVPQEVVGPACSWLANRMVREFRTEDNVASLAMEGVLLEILAESARAFGENGGSNAPSWLRKTHESLEASYLLAPSLAELAALAGVHPVHLSREFRRHYHMTVGEYIRKRRIQHASQLLSHSGLSLSEIAATCGFSDQSHFCALFKRHAGMTPAKFRDLSAR
jgi:AraC family transcriptional regulator